MIGIIDYGVGNLRSVENAFKKIGIDSFISSDPSRLAKAKALVLPGVGAFAKAGESLQKSGCIPLIKEWIAREKPFLGICLGFQLLFEESEESFCGEESRPQGLGIFPGKVKRFAAGELKIPQIGWNSLKIKKQNPFYQDIPEGSYAYFVHSYYVQPGDSEIVATETHYGIWYASSIATERLLAVQFHPEKSSKVGLSILKKFGGLVNK